MPAPTDGRKGTSLPVISDPLDIEPEDLSYIVKDPNAISPDTADSRMLPQSLVDAGYSAWGAMFQGAAGAGQLINVGAPTLINQFAGGTRSPLFRMGGNAASGLFTTVFPGLYRVSFRAEAQDGTGQDWNLAFEINGAAVNEPAFQVAVPAAAAWAQIDVWLSVMVDTAQTVGILADPVTSNETLVLRNASLDITRMGVYDT